MDFVFLWPFCAIALLFPVGIWLLSPPYESSAQSKALCVPFFKAFQNQTGQSHRVNHFVPTLLMIFGFIALTAAAMRPVLYEQSVDLPTTGRQMMLALDTSGSMATPDFEWNGQRTTRLNAVQNVVYDFIKNRSGDAVGLTIFGDEAFLYTPLTLDSQTAAQMVREIGAGIAGENTAIGSALLMSLKQMKDIPANKKVIILLSDGVSNVNTVSPLDAIKVAQNMGVKVYTIGIGSNKIYASFDEVLLKKIASDTNGKYFRVATSKDLQQVYRLLDQLEPADLKHLKIRPQKELFFVPLLVAMILFLMGFYLKDRL